MANTEAKLQNKKVKLANLRTKYIKEALEKKVNVKDYVEKKMKAFRASMTDFKPTTTQAKTNTVKKADNKPKEEITETINKIKKEVSKKDSAYKIRSGDTLSQIAKAKGTTVRAIMAANPNIKDANKIRAGASLTIPAPKIRQVSKTSDMPSAPPKAVRPVTLKSGEKGTAAQRLSEIEKEKGMASLRSRVTELAKNKKGMNVGGAALKSVPSANTGLKKLPTPVRNKMGYMSKGGTPKKANKGMLIISIGMKKKKNASTKKKKK